MKALILVLAVVSIAAPCAGVSLSLGDAAGAPGEQVKVGLKASPGGLYTGFDFTIDFNENALSFDGVSLSSDAKTNGINEINISKVYKGRYSIAAKSALIGALKSISDLGSLKFTIVPSAPFVDIQIQCVGGASVRIAAGIWSAASISGAHIVITAPVTPLPTGTPPQLTLSMQSPPVIPYGQEAVLRYRLRVVDPSWDGFPADGYLAVSMPSGALLFMDRRGRFTGKVTPAAPGMTIGNVGDDMRFGPLTADLPAGRYTFYAVMAYVGADPRKSAGRISNLTDAYFELTPVITGMRR
ncbi:MAG: hypothetical protein NT045_07625 [Candidatus Aureabacteria bacterium]|nr:hypothetical protein [Candidatus Auribacterota bacterium]